MLQSKSIPPAETQAEIYALCLDLCRPLAVGLRVEPEELASDVMLAALLSWSADKSRFEDAWKNGHGRFYLSRVARNRGHDFIRTRVRHVAGEYFDEHFSGSLDAHAIGARIDSSAHNRLLSGMVHLQKIRVPVALFQRLSFAHDAHGVWVLTDREVREALAMANLSDELPGQDLLAKCTQRFDASSPSTLIWRPSSVGGSDQIVFCEALVDAIAVPESTVSCSKDSIERRTEPFSLAAVRRVFVELSRIAGYRKAERYEALADFLNMKPDTLRRQVHRARCSR